MALSLLPPSSVQKDLSLDKTQARSHGWELLFQAAAHLINLGNLVYLPKITQGISDSTVFRIKMLITTPVFVFL